MQQLFYSIATINLLWLKFKRLTLLISENLIYESIINIRKFIVFLLLQNLKDYYGNKVAINIQKFMEKVNEN